MKSTVDEIRHRFDRDVERFSNLETGQVAQLDAPLHLDLLTEAAAMTTRDARRVLDVGCGAGNYTLRLLQRFPDPNLDVTLLDLSRPMLDRAVQRVSAATTGRVIAMQDDIRNAHLGEAAFDIILAAQCLHHLRGDVEWQDVFRRIFRSLRPGGSFWICDSITQDLPAVEAMMQRRWGDYLVSVKDDAYRDHVFAYVDKEDTPRSLPFQLDLLRAVGFAQVDVLHKHSRFASFGALKR